MKRYISYIVFAAIMLMCNSCSKYGLPFGKASIKLNVKTLDTKGRVITTDNFTTLCSDGFVMDVWLDEQALDNGTGNYTDYHYVDAYTVVWNGSKYETPYYWANGINTRFWLWAPVDVSSRTVDTSDLKGKNTLSFTYSQPSHDGMDDAAQEKDLLFSYVATSREFDSNGDIRGGKTDAIDVIFQHALSEVGFTYHSTDGTFSNGLRINYVKLIGVQGRGSCVYNGSDNTFTWTPSGSTMTFGQTYKIDHEHQGDFDTIPDLVLNPDPSHSIHMNNPFFMIPQTLGSEAKLEVEFLRRDGTTITKQASLSGAKWEARTYYAYKIVAKTIQDDVQFSVTVVEWQNGGSAELTPKEAA